METTKKIKFSAIINLAGILKTIWFLIAVIAIMLIFMALQGCSSETPEETEVNVVTHALVEGTVKDEDGNTYPNSKVKATNGTESRGQSTDSDGFYRIKTNNTGAYSLELTPPLATEIITTNPTTVMLDSEKTVESNFVIQPQPVKAHLNFGDVQLLEEIVDKNGNTPVDPNEPLYAANIFDAPIGQLTAIKAPDDHHVTLSEFKAATGNLMVHCNGNFSSIVVNLEGLIPNGTYTFWLAYLNKTRKVGEQINFANDFVNRTNPPIGASNGTENILVASANGTINATLEHDDCILTEEVALVIPVLYHINGKTFGGGHVPDAEETVQLLAYFQ